MKSPVNRAVVNTSRTLGAHQGGDSGKGGVQAPVVHPALLDYWSFGAKTNTDPARKFITGVNGNVLWASSFLFRRMSGYGGFAQDISLWWPDRDAASVDLASNTAHVSGVRSGLPFLSYESHTPIRAFGFRLTGIAGRTLVCTFIDEGGTEILRFTEDGVYTTPEKPPGYIGFSIEGNGPCDIFIKEIPLYPGAIVLDGMDDSLSLMDADFPKGDYTVIARVVPLEGDSGNPVFCTGETYLGYLPGNESMLFGNQTYRESARFPGASGKVKLLAMVRSGNFITLYQDLEPIGSVEVPDEAANGVSYFLGVDRSLSAYFRGAIYCNAVYSAAFTPAEILRQVNRAFPFYESIIMNR